ncbi:MAG: hypothetical protein AAF734_08035, partial [Bacteroidota bacterium]
MTGFSNITRLRFSSSNNQFYTDNLVLAAAATNAAPTASSFTANPSENLVYTFATGDFGYSDTDSDPLDHVLIESLPTSGTLYVDANDNDDYDGGEEVSVNDQISKVDLDAGNLQYLQNGSTNTSFQFEVNDGTDTSTGNYVATLTMLPQSEFYVSTTGDDSNTGLDFNNAYLTLQKALEESESFGVGAKIYVAAGTYKPTQGWDVSTDLTSTTANSESFRIPSGVEVYGGFTGSETGIIDQSALDARNISANETILSGDIGNDDNVTGSGTTLSFSNTSDNVYHVVYTRNVSSTTIVDGFTIKGGSATGSFPNNNSAGWYNNGRDGGSSNPTIRNCLFTENNADAAGGGLFNDGNNGEASPIITYSRFDRNRGGIAGGAGMYNTGNVNGISSPIITNCTFTRNLA